MELLLSIGEKSAEIIPLPLESFGVCVVIGFCLEVYMEQVGENHMLIMFRHIRYHVWKLLNDSTG